MEEYPRPGPEELRRMDEKREGELSKKRERRLKHVQGHLRTILGNISSEAPDEFDVTYEIMHEYSGNLGVLTDTPRKVSYENSPAYRFFLTRKDDPKSKYPIMHLLRPDVDKNIKVSDIPQEYQLSGLGYDHITEGLEKLKREEGGGLESTLGIISLILISASLFFLSSNVIGYTIATLPRTFFNPIGAVLFSVGLIISLFYFRLSLGKSSMSKPKVKE
jgi:hypothetical protein